MLCLPSVKAVHFFQDCHAPRGHGTSAEYPVRLPVGWVTSRFTDLHEGGIDDSARKLLASAAFAAVVLSAPADAQQIVTGEIHGRTLTAAPTLTGLGLTAAPTGTATVATDMSGIPTFTFPITGGASTLPAMLYSTTKAPASCSRPAAVRSALATS